MLLSASEIISQSINLYKKNIKNLLGYVGLMALVTIIMTILSEYVFPMLFNAQQPLWIFGLEVLALVMVTTVLNIWFAIAMINAIAQIYTKQTVTKMQPMLKQTATLVLPAFFASILVAITIFAGAIFFIIPAIIFGVWFTFVTHQIALNNKKPIQAIKASRKLVLGRWWSVLWRLIAPGIVFIIMIWVAQFIVGFLLSLVTSLIGESTILTIVTVIILSATTMLFVPFSSAAQTILYLDLQAKPLKKATATE